MRCLVPLACLILAALAGCRSVGTAVSPAIEWEGVTVYGQVSIHNHYDRAHSDDTQAAGKDYGRAFSPAASVAAAPGSTSGPATVSDAAPAFDVSDRQGSQPEAIVSEPAKPSANQPAELPKQPERQPEDGQDSHSGQ